MQYVCTVCIDSLIQSFMNTIFGITLPQESAYGFVINKASVNDVFFQCNRHLQKIYQRISTLTLARALLHRQAQKLFGI